MSRSLAAIAGSVATIAAFGAGALIGSATDLPDTHPATAETLAAYTLSVIAEFPDALTPCATAESTNCAYTSPTAGHSFVTFGDNYELVF